MKIRVRHSILIKECKDEHLLEYARDIQSASQTLLSIVNDILDISKIESGKMDILPIQYELFSVINDCYNMIFFKAQDKKLELELKRMRSARKGSDHALVKEGMADEAYIRGYRRYRGIRDDYGPVPMAGEIGVPVMPGGMDVCGAGETGGGINPGDIVVSGESTF